MRVNNYRFLQETGYDISTTVTIRQGGRYYGGTNYNVFDAATLGFDEVDRNHHVIRLTCNQYGGNQ